MATVPISLGRLLAAVIALTSTALIAQQSKPAFEVASVRPTISGSLSEITLDFQPRRFVATMLPLRWLIAVAYGREGREVETIERILGGPSWIDSVPFDIQATTEEAVPQATMRLMLQRLLGERFGLRLRSEQRNMEVYALLLNRSDGRLGPQLKPGQGRDCSKLTFEQQRDRRCGEGYYRDKGTMMEVMYGSDKDMAELIEHVGGPAFANLQRPVVDQTGLAGRFDYEVRFSEPSRGLSLSPAAEPSAPDIFKAFREQLGLKLEPMTAPVDVLVIESVQEPTAN